MEILLVMTEVFQLPNVKMFWMLNLIFCIALFLVWFTPKYLWYRRTKKLINRLPGPKANTMSMLGDAKLGLMQKKSISELTTYTPSALYYLHRKVGYVSGWIVFTPMVLLGKAEFVEVVLSSNVNVNKTRSYKLLQPWLGNGLLISNGILWRKHRKILTPAFHFRILEEFIPIVNEQANILVGKLAQKSSEPWIDLHPLVKRCTLDIICETSMGIQLGSQNIKNLEYIEAIDYVQEIILYRAAFPWLYPDFIFYSLPIGRRYSKKLKTIHAFTKEVVKQRRREILEKKSNNGFNFNEKFRKPNGRLALLDLLLHYHLNNKELTEQEVQDEVNTFMFGGQDTTALNITWTLYLLGLHPEIQARVHEEIDSIFGSDMERPVSSDDVKIMKYLDCVIKESLRLYPPAPFLFREITEDTSLTEGHIIPAGCVCTVLIQDLHRDEDYFNKPHHFIPERFLPETSKGRHPYAFIPFSVGPRNCIGQKFAMNETKVILAWILRNFSVKSLDHQDKLFLDGNVTLKPRNPIRVKIIPRYILY